MPEKSGALTKTHDENITGESWLMRDLWQTTNMNYGARWGLATNPKEASEYCSYNVFDLVQNYTIDILTI
ncbi:MAG: hypothetical protein ACJ72T_09525 [Nitrososphaeraceae archaeon]